jgi:pimeloyl-ACP methyl ester carboxylesterase
MSGRPSGPLTRRSIARNLIALGAVALMPRAIVAASATTPQAPPASRLPPKERAKPLSADGATKTWLTLPPTPALPAAKRSGIVSLKGTPVFFAQFGEGPAVLLLHGGLGNSNYWGHQIRALADNFSVTVMDTRGHGRSTLTSPKFGFNLFADDVADLLAHLGIPSVAIVGWSDGAITGLQLAITRPALVTKLFAFGANSSVSGLKPGGSKTPVFASYIGRCASEYAHLSPHPERWSQLTSGLGVMWRTQPSFTKEQLATIKPPVVVSDGEYDEIIKREHTEQISQQIPNSRLLIQPAVSHFAMLQNPTQFNQAIVEFLATAN